MKKYFQLMLIVGVFLTIQAKGNIIGGELKVDYLAGNDYNVSLILYSECNFGELADSMLLTFSATVNNFSQMFPKVSSTEISPVCVNSLASTNCNGGTLYGYEKVVYTRQVSLVPAEWFIVFSSCCRMPCVTLSSPGSTNFYIYFKFNSQIAPGNHLPYFSSEPMGIIKKSTFFHYNHGVIDPDGDSISMKFVKVLGGYNTPAIYTGSYYANRFLQSGAPEDSVTGDFYIQNNYYAQTGVYAVEVTEWKTIGGISTLVSRQIRDMVVKVVDETLPNLPILAGINPMATGFDYNDISFRDSVMAGDTIEFNIYPLQPLQNNLNLSFPKQIPDAILTVSQNNTQNVQGHFSWVPTSGKIGKGPKIFTALIKDDYCDYYNYQIYSYSLDVKGLFLRLAPDTNANLLLGQLYSLKAICSEANKFDWYVDGTRVQSDTNKTYEFLSQALGAGDHTVGCKAYDSANANKQGFEFVNVHVQNIWSVAEATGEDVVAFPNPAIDYIFFEAGIKENLEVQIYNINGQLQLKEKLTDNHKKVSLIDFASGLYFYILYDGENYFLRGTFIKL